jgi:alpha-1,2-mannosyltransferase
MNVLSTRKARIIADMDVKSQTKARAGLIALAVLCVLPSLAEGFAVVWGNAHGMTGKALRDGLDFWAGGFLALHGQAGAVFDPPSYTGFITGLFGKLPPHIWSYPPNYLLLASGFGWLGPWHAVLAFDVLSLALLVAVLRLADQNWWLAAAVAASPAGFENLLEGQNAALVTALIGGGILLLEARPRLGGALVGLASIKPQLGLVLPLFLLRRAPVAFGFAVLAALTLAGASVLAFGPGVWAAFWHVTRPAMNAVLLTGQPKEFAGGLISVFAVVRRLGLHAALVVQAVVTLAAVMMAARTHKPAVVLVLAALASPYLHVYDLLGVTLAVALLIKDRLERGFYPGEPLLFFVAWFGPGAMPWSPAFAHLTPLVLLLLLASAAARGRVQPCDSTANAPGLSAGP